MLKRFLIGGVVSIFLVVSLYIGYSVYLAPSLRGGGSPPPEIWKLQPGQTFVKNSSSAFAIKWVTITPQGFRFFYAFQSPYQDIHVKVSSSPASSAKTATDLKTTMQVLKHVQTYTVGVIYAEHLSHLGQVISLQITVPEEKTTNWNLSLLHQVGIDPHENTAEYGLYPGGDELPEVTWYGPVREQEVAYFKVTGSVQDHQQPAYIFVRSDDPLKVKTITKDEYLRLAGSENFNS